MNGGELCVLVKVIDISHEISVVFSGSWDVAIERTDDLNSIISANLLDIFPFTLLIWNSKSV